MKTKLHIINNVPILKKIEKTKNTKLYHVDIVGGHDYPKFHFSEVFMNSDAN